MAPWFIPVFLLLSLSVVVLVSLGYPQAGGYVAACAPAILRRAIRQLARYGLPVRRGRPRRDAVVFALTCMASVIVLCALGHPEGAWPAARLMLGVLWMIYKASPTPLTDSATGLSCSPARFCAVMGSRCDPDGPFWPHDGLSWLG